MVLTDAQIQAKVDSAVQAALAARPVSVQAATLKLPPFWTTDPEIWFEQIEAFFDTNNPKITTDATKYKHVVQALDAATAKEVRHILVKPEADKTYKELKTALIKVFGKSRAEQDQELLSITHLGDRKPSALLRQMQALNADPDTLLRALFLRTLPADMRGMLANATTAKLEDLADQADNIMDAMATSSQPLGISAAHQPVRRSSPTWEESRSLCRYHKQWGKDARKCQHGGCPMSHLAPQVSKQERTSGNAVTGR